MAIKIKKNLNINPMQVFSTQIYRITFLDIKRWKYNMFQFYRELGVCQNGIYVWINHYYLYSKLSRREVF